MTTDGRMPLAASSVMDDLTAAARDYFGRVPALVTTDRLGRFEGGWTRPRPGRPLQGLGYRKGLPMSDKQRLRQRMSTLIREYAKHPQAQESAVKRVDDWPDCIEIHLSWGE